MTSFIKLDVSKGFIYVNPDAIAYIRENTDGQTVIHFCASEHDGLCVKAIHEPISSVIAKIEKTGQCRIIE